MTKSPAIVILSEATLPLARRIADGLDGQVHGLARRVAGGADVTSVVAYRTVPGSGGVDLPALLRAQKLTKRAARVGFDWPDVEGAWEKLDEELGELDDALIDGGNVAEEVGDALFALVNVARKLGVDPEEALRATNAKFCRRFAHIESSLREQGRDLASSNLEEMDRLWNEAKDD